MQNPGIARLPTHNFRSVVQNEMMDEVYWALIRATSPPQNFSLPAFWTGYA